MSSHLRLDRPIGGKPLVGLVVLGAGPGERTRHRSVNGTIWVANRGAHTIRGFDARTGAVVQTVAMAPNSQPGDLAYAKGKLYVAEEFGTPPAVAVVDADTGMILKRIVLAAGARPHHVHASVSGRSRCGRPVRDRPGRRHRHARRYVARSVGQQSFDDEWPGARGESSRRTETLYLASRRHQRGHRHGPAHRDRALAHERARRTRARRHSQRRKASTSAGGRPTRLASSISEKQTFEDVLTLGLPDTLRCRPTRSS